MPDSADAATGVPAPIEAPAPSPSGGRKIPRSPWLWVAAIVILAVVVVIAGLWSLSLGPFGPPARGPAAQTFREAAQSANGSASGVPGGPWTIVGAFGFQFRSSSLQSFAGIPSMLGASGCTASVFGGNQIVGVPSTDSSPNSGSSPAWILWYAGTGSDLLMVVIGGSASPLAKLGGSNCPLTSGAARLSLPNGTIDSSAAAEAAFTQGGSDFASAHPGADVILQLTPRVNNPLNGAVQGSTWTVTYSNCDLTGLTGTTLDEKPPAEFADLVNPVTGAPQNGTTDHSACSDPSQRFSGSHPTFSSVAEGENVSGSAPTYSYSMTTDSAPAGAVWGTTSVRVESGNGSSFTTPDATIRIVDPTQTCVLAVYPLSTQGWQDPASGACTGVPLGGQARVLSGEGLSVISSTNLDGRGLWLAFDFGGSAASTGFVAIP